MCIGYGCLWDGFIVKDYEGYYVFRLDNSEDDVLYKNFYGYDEGEDFGWVYDLEVLRFSFNS